MLQVCLYLLCSFPRLRFASIIGLYFSYQLFVQEVLFILVCLQLTSGSFQMKKTAVSIFNASEVVPDLPPQSVLQCLYSLVLSNCSWSFSSSEAAQAWVVLNLQIFLNVESLLVILNVKQLPASALLRVHGQQLRHQSTAPLWTLNLAQSDSSFICVYILFLQAKATSEKITFYQCRARCFGHTSVDKMNVLHFFAGLWEEAHNRGSIVLLALSIQEITN